MKGRVSGGAGNGESIFGMLKDPCVEDCGEWGVEDGHHCKR